MFTKTKTWLGQHLWIGPVLAGIALRLYKITSSSIWHDEGYTMWLLRYDFFGIIERTARDVHPPGYYLLAKPWVTVFGNSVFSIRFLSLLFSVGIIYFVYKIIAEIWNGKAALWATTFVALSPFMVRFGQEARMYGVVAFFTTLATYLLVKMIKEKRAKYLYFYVPAMLIAMYTQYYAFFVVISHWIILSIFTTGFWSLRWKSALKDVLGVFSWRWWLANIALLVGYAAWFPVAYKQVTRVSGSYWIQPEWITMRTVPNNIIQFANYTHFDKIYTSGILGVILYWVVIAVAILGPAYLLKNKAKRKTVIALYVFGFLPMVLVYTLSELRTPIYQDRYFPFSAVGIFALWGVAISEFKNRYLKYGFMGVVIGIMLLGNYIMHIDADHQMLQMTTRVKENAQPGDIILSGELYTFLDGSYYFDYDGIRLMSLPVDGYGESSLFYDQQDTHVVDRAFIDQDRVWIIGKTGDKEYFSDKTWKDYHSVTYYEDKDKSNSLKAVLYIKN